MRDDRLVDADADAQDAEAHAAAQVGGGTGTLAVRVVIGTVARLRRRNAVCFWPARVSGLVR